MQKRISTRVLALFASVCILLSSFAIGVFASDDSEDYIGIYLTDEHREELLETFSTLTGASGYAKTKHSTELIVGTKLTLGVVGHLNTDYEVIWSSGDESVATIDESGELLAVGEGSTVIVATAGDILASVVIDVRNTFTLTYDEANMSVNKLCNLDVDIRGDLTKYVYDFEWKSENKNVAVVGSGLILASTTGTGAISATIKEKTTGKTVDVASCTIVIHPDITAVEIKNDRKELELGLSLKLGAQTVPEKQPVVWVSSDESIATVDGGLVTTVGVGVVTIYAYAGCWSYNEYIAVSDIVSSVTIDVWSPETMKYGVSVAGGAKGEVTVDKTSALAGETVTVYTESLLESYGNEYEMFGASSVSVIDKNGMAIEAKSEGKGVYTFVMPNSKVEVSAIYSSMYGISYNDSQNANFARNDNLIGDITVTEFIGGSFAGTFKIASPGVDISNVVCNYGTVSVNDDGTAVLVIDDKRAVATKISIKIYADAQVVDDGAHEISISDTQTIHLNNAFIASTAGEILPQDVVVSEEAVKNLTQGATLSVSSSGAIVIYGETMQLIKSKNISLDFTMKNGRIQIPYTSLRDADAENGGFTVFSIVETGTSGTKSDEIIGVYSISIQCYMGTGSNKNQMNVIGAASVGVTNVTDEKIIMQTGSATYSTTNGMFSLPSLSGTGAFIVSRYVPPVTLGDIISIVIILILIAAAGVAIYFLLKKKNLIGKNSVFAQRAIVEENIEETMDDGSDEYDESTFKTVDAILKEADMEEQARRMLNEAINELMSEIGIADETTEKANEIMTSVEAVNRLIDELPDSFVDSEIAIADYRSALSIFNEKSYMLGNEKVDAEEVISLIDEDTDTGNILAKVDSLREANAECSSALDMLNQAIPAATQVCVAETERTRKMREGVVNLSAKIAEFNERNDNSYKSAVAIVKDMAAECEGYATIEESKKYCEDFNVESFCREFISMYSNAISLVSTENEKILNGDNQSAEYYDEKIDEISACMASLDDGVENIPANRVVLGEASVIYRERIEAKEKEAREMLDAAQTAAVNALGSVTNLKAEFDEKKADAEKAVSRLENKGKLEGKLEACVKAEEKAREAAVNDLSKNPSQIMATNDAEDLANTVSALLAYADELEAIVPKLCNISASAQKLYSEELHDKARKNLADTCDEAKEVVRTTEDTLAVISDQYKHRGRYQVNAESFIDAYMGVSALVTTTKDAIARAADLLANNDANTDELVSASVSLGDLMKAIRSGLERVNRENDRLNDEYAASTAEDVEKEMQADDEVQRLVRERNSSSRTPDTYNSRLQSAASRAYAEHRKTVAVVRGCQNPSTEHTALLEYSNALYNSIVGFMSSAYAGNKDEELADVIGMIDADCNLEIEARENLGATGRQASDLRRSVQKSTAELLGSNKYIREMSTKAD